MPMFRGQGEGPVMEVGTPNEGRDWMVWPLDDNQVKKVLQGGGMTSCVSSGYETEHCI